MPTEQFKGAEDNHGQSHGRATLLLSHAWLREKTFLLGCIGFKMDTGAEV